MKKKIFFLFLILSLVLLPVVSASFGYDNPNLPKLENPNAFIGNFSWNGNCLDGGVEIRNDGTICAQRLDVFNITSVNITKQTITILENLISLGNITAPWFIGNQQGNSSIWSRVGTNTFLTNIDDRVGIGTPTPDSIFHIKANIAGSVGSHSAGQIIIQNPTNSVFSNVVITAYESDGAGNPDQQLWYLGSSSVSNTDIIFLNRRNSKLQLGTDGAAKMTILGDGNVGIGTTTPQNTLNVIGDGNFTGNLYVGGNLTLAQKITFAFGEIIDNIVDGWLTITGNLNVTGNVTAENVFLPSFLFAHTNNTIQVASAGVWYNVTFDEQESSPKLRVTHTYNDATNDTFTIVDDGYYNLHYAMSFESAQATPTSHVVMRVIKNGVEIPGSLLEEDATKQYADFTISNGPIIYLVTGDEIVFQFTSDDTDVSLTSHRTYGDHHDTAVVKIIRVA